MESKGKDTSELRNKKFLCEVAFLCDITSHLNALNLQLQGRGRVITDTYATVRAFKTKLRLWETQILQENLSHFPHCQTMKEQVAAAVFPTRQFTEKLGILGADFTRRFADFEAQKSSFRLFDEQKDVLILVFLEEIPMQQLSPYHRMRRLLKRQTYLSWSRAVAHPDLFWEKLRQALETREDPAGEHLLLSVGDGIPGERPDQ
ncbi:hypothetical protein NHX12_021182 [Muraenolepis orangiensis]|uniref:Uncharacterized protein n=1 Tax=Muraenolepis orangiensis TaxID=630683 RepID=A0A9Q0EQ28_9TELE|nr:hypothetical protein NHX12_021182 [Muraenolepis orangiensis]